MWTLLAGVPGKLKAIASKLTADLNVPMSSRAPTSTALSNAVWTDVRAEKLDLISSGGMIKSIQRGTRSVSSGTNTVTIAEVDPLKSFATISQNGGHYNDTGTGQSWALMAGIELNTSTSIRIYRASLTTNTASPTAYWQVVEFY